MLTLKLNLSPSFKRLTCVYCGNPFKGLIKVIVVHNNKEASLAHKECYGQNNNSL